MKKKLKELTKDEREVLCKKQGDCETCQYFGLCNPNTMKQDEWEEFADQEVEI